MNKIKTFITLTLMIISLMFNIHAADTVMSDTTGHLTHPAQLSGNIIAYQATNALEAAPYGILYNDTNHTYAFYTNGLLKSISTAPNSTNAGFSEFFQNYPWNTNGISSGCKLFLVNGVYTISNQIPIPDNCIIQGAGRASTVLYYVGPANQSYGNLIANYSQYAVINIVTNSWPGIQPGYQESEVTLRDFGIKFQTNSYMIGVFSKAWQFRSENLAIYGPHVLTYPYFHTPWIEPAFIPAPQKNIGMIMDGDGSHSTKYDYYYDLACAVYVTGNVYYLSDDDQGVVISQWSGGFGNAFPASDDISLGGVITIPRSSHIYYYNIKGIKPYRSESPVFVGAGKGEISDFIDQYSQYPIGIFPTGGDTVPISLTFKTSNYDATGQQGIGVPSPAVISVGIDGSGNLSYNYPESSYTNDFNNGCVDVERIGIDGHAWYWGNNFMFGFINGQFIPDYCCSGNVFLVNVPAYFSSTIGGDGSLLTNIPPTAIVGGTNGTFTGGHFTVVNGIITGWTP